VALTPKLSDQETAGRSLRKGRMSRCNGRKGNRASFRRAGKRNLEMMDAGNKGKRITVVPITAGRDAVQFEHIDRRMVLFPTREV